MYYTTRVKNPAVAKPVDPEHRRQVERLTVLLKIIHMMIDLDATCVRQGKISGYQKARLVVDVVSKYFNTAQTNGFPHVRNFRRYLDISYSYNRPMCPIRGPVSTHPNIIEI